MKEFTHTRLDSKQFSQDDIKGFIKDYNIKFIKLQFVDINGQVKNMTIPSQHIEKALNNEIMLDGSSIKGFRSIETSDMVLRLSSSCSQKIKTEMLQLQLRIEQVTMT